MRTAKHCSDLTYPLMKRILTLILSILTISAAAQSPWDGAEASFGACADAYYSYYSNAKDVRYQQHDCIGAFHNNLGLNIAQFTGSFDSDRFRGVHDPTFRRHS